MIEHALDSTRDNSHISLNSHPLEWVNPIKEDAYFGLAGDFVRFIERHTESDPVAVLIQFQTYFGNIIGNSAHFKVEATIHNLKLNCILVGQTSKGRKGTSHNLVNFVYGSIDPIWTRENIVSGLSSGEGVIAALADQDTSKQDKRLLIVEQEMSSTLKVMSREGNILSAIIRQAWDGQDLRNLTKNNPLRASNTHISIIGHITIAELKKYLSVTEMANGFGNRFLYPLVRRSKCLPEGGNISSLDLGHIVNRLREAVNFAKTTGEIKRDPSAKDFWAHIYPQLSEGRQGIVGDLTARSEAYVMRLACIYALLESSKEIRPVHLRAALAVWSYCESSVEFIFGDMTGNAVADHIMIAIKANKDGLTRTDISNSLGRHRSSVEIDSALELLLRNGKAVMEPIMTEGRPKELWKAA